MNIGIFSDVHDNIPFMPAPSPGPETIKPCSRGTRACGTKMQVLLITSRSGRRWGIPKGIVEPNLTASAAKEAFEEAGIEGQIHAVSVGSYERPKWGGICTVEVFLVNVERQSDEWEESFRERAWLTLEEALSRVDEQGLRRLLHKVPSFLEAQLEEGR